MQFIDLRPPVALVPVVEWPAGLTADGLTTLEPQDPRLVRLDGSVPPAALLRLIEATRPDFADVATGARSTPLDGGYALTARGAGIVHPQCCGDLGNLADWKSALDEGTGCWKELWIGHPCLVHRREGEHVLLQGYVEPGSAPVQPLEDVPAWRVPVGDLAAAIAGAERARLAAVPALGAALPERQLAQGLAETVAWLLGIPEDEILSVRAALGQDREAGRAPVDDGWN